MNGFNLDTVHQLLPPFAVVEWVVGVILIVVAGAFFFGMRRAPTVTATSNILDRVSNNNRARIAPVKRIYEDISSIVAKNQTNAAVKVIGGETISEADLILNQCVKMLGHRDRILKSGAFDPNLADASSQLRSRAESAQSEEEKRSLESAAAAYEITSAQAGKAREALDRIDAGMKEAEAALELMKSRLNAAALGTDGPSSYDEDFRESIMRLRSLEGSLTEALEMESDLRS
ncbi:MAG: hypothetical protein KF784_14535 [Fimbriimonadaceae bacterium]|nr:hypothetical protein [Fimbriimonadaceae bacterium]